MTREEENVVLAVARFKQNDQPAKAPNESCAELVKHFIGLASIGGLTIEPLGSGGLRWAIKDRGSEVVLAVVDGAIRVGAGDELVPVRGLIWNSGSWYGFEQDARCSAVEVIANAVIERLRASGHLRALTQRR